MNPISKELWQEGMCVGTFKLVSGGHFDEEGVIALFQKAGEYPGTSATRRIDHNLTDLQGMCPPHDNLVQANQQLLYRPMREDLTWSSASSSNLVPVRSCIT